MVTARRTFVCFSSALANRKSVKTFPDPGVTDVLLFAETRFIVFLILLAISNFGNFGDFGNSLPTRPAPPLLSSAAPACSSKTADSPRKFPMPPDSLPTDKKLAQHGREP